MSNEHGGEQYFRLHRLRIRHYPPFIATDIIFSKEPAKFTGGSNFYTLLIGPNGTGKSRIMRLLIDIFRYVADKNARAKRIHYPAGEYLLEYFHNDAVYTITNAFDFFEGNQQNQQPQKHVVRFFRGGTELKEQPMPIPTAILALSVLLSDRYPYIHNPLTFKSFKYLGIRRNSNTAGTKELVTRTVELVLQSISRPFFSRNLNALLSLIDVKSEFTITYKLRHRKRVFDRPNAIAEKDLEDFIFSYKEVKSKRKTTPWNVSVYNRLKKEDPVRLERVIAAINLIILQNQKPNDEKKTTIEINLFEIADVMRLIMPYLKDLHDLDLISYPSIMLRKTDSFKIEESSAGELHILTTGVALLAQIQNGGLILIDEPEVSLHPNWQMRYVAFLDKLVHEYQSLHFVICSHSHFLVSDLPAHKSILVALNENAGIEAKVLQSSTFGWSAEQILLEVFKVPTTRNYFVAERLGEILELIAMPENIRPFDLIKSKVEELINLDLHKLSKEDPLSDVVLKLVETYGK